MNTNFEIKYNFVLMKLSFNKFFSKTIKGED